MSCLVNLKDLPLNVEGDIQEFQVENCNKYPRQDLLPLKEALQQYLEWNGIQGYTHDILEIVDAVFKGRLKLLTDSLVDPSTTDKLRRVIDIRIDELKQLRGKGINQLTKGG